LLVIKKILNAIVFSNIWISLGAVGTTLVYFLNLKLTIDYNYLILVFFATLFAYNFQYINGQKENNQRQLQSYWLSKNSQLIKTITYSSLLISVVLSFFIFPLNFIWLSLPAVILVVMYKHGINKKFYLRNIPFIKIIVISFCWMWTCTILPQLLNNFFFDWKISLFIFLYVFTITLPFDIRDNNLDDQSIKTVPQLIGLKKTYFLSLFMLLVLMVFSYFIYDNFIVYFILLTLILMIPSYKPQSENYYLFILDGLLVVFPIFVM
tara:strand:- start:164 stop:958 length:795 start_codon:yes stop_codon:yes gene_type:complete